MKRIPKRFQLLNHTIDVVSIPESKWKWGESWAYWDAGETRILICRGKATVAFHSFCHEVTHCLLEMAGRADLSRSEALVDVMGGLIAQFLSTAE